MDYFVAPVAWARASMRGQNVTKLTGMHDFRRTVMDSRVGLVSWYRDKMRRQNVRNKAEKPEI